MALATKTIEFEWNGTATRLTLGALSVFHDALIGKYERERDAFLLESFGIDVESDSLYDDIRKYNATSAWVQFNIAVAVLACLRSWEQKGKAWEPVEWERDLLGFAGMVDLDFLLECQDAYHELNPRKFSDYRPRSDEEKEETESAEKNEQTPSDEE